MVNTTFNSSDDMINNLQQLRGKTKLKIYKNISNYYDNMIIKFDEDLFAKNAQGISKIHHEVLKVMKFLQTKPQVKNMNINYYDLYYTVNKNRDEKEIVDIQFENNENEYISLNDVIIPYDYVRMKNRDI